MDSNRGIGMQIMDRKREQEDIESGQNLWLEDISNVDDFRSSQDDLIPSTSASSIEDSEESCSSQVFNSQSSICHKRKIKKLTKRKISKHRRLDQYKSLNTLEERKRLRKITASRLRKAKYTANTVERFRYWKEKVNRK